MQEEMKNNIKESSTWTRGFYMILFIVLYGIAEIILFGIILFQFLSLLFTAKTNVKLLTLGQSLSTYVYQIVIYLTFNSEKLVYPFAVWPKGAPSVVKKAATKK